MKRVILIGLSGSGKSTVARALAKRLGYQLVDIDDEIVSQFGASIPEIFAQYGEAVFRTVERETIASACGGMNRVIATGGGVVADDKNWLSMRPESLIVHLHASPDEILARLRDQVARAPAARRPLLESDDPRMALDRLWQARRVHYQQADITIDTTGRDPDSIASDVEVAVMASRDGTRPVPIASIGTPSGRSDLYVSAGILEHAGRLVRQRFPRARRAWIITDSNVGPLWADQLAGWLAPAGLAVERLEVSAGESSKSLSHVAGLLDELLDRRVERRDVIVALGGGVIGDLAGFVAAIALRGIGLVQIPTSLLAMVDSSVGGKTGVNHARGKNLIGSFYQPALVLADPLVLQTLPERDIRGGWGEIIKHAMIESTASEGSGAQLIARIESASDDQLRDSAFITDIVRRNVLIKSAVVQSDEREDGLRRILNYGHTLGHAMEASGYHYHHGEAIALGMRAAADLAIRLGRSSADVARRQNDLLDRIGLPSRFEGSLSDVLARLASDKKAIHGQLTWILPGQDAGSVDIVSGVPMDDVEATAVAIGARR